MPHSTVLSWNVVLTNRPTQCTPEHAGQGRQQHRNRCLRWTTSRCRPRRLHPALLRRFRRLLSRSSQKPFVLGWLERQFLQQALVCRSVEVFGSHVALVLGTLHLLQTDDLVTNGVLIHSQRTWSCLVFPTPVREHIPIAAVESVSTATLMVRPISSSMCFVKILRAEPFTIP